MSSTDRAPEPTMEEILASIRRIISDQDEQGPAGAGAQPQNARGQAPAPMASSRPAPPPGATPGQPQPPQAAPQNGPAQAGPALNGAREHQQMQPPQPMPMGRAEEIPPPDVRPGDDIGLRMGMRTEPNADVVPSMEEDDVLDLGNMSAVAEETEPEFTEMAVEEEPLDLSEDINLLYEEEPEAPAAGAPQGSALEAAIAALKGEQAKRTAQPGEAPLEPEPAPLQETPLFQAEALEELAPFQPAVPPFQEIPPLQEPAPLQESDPFQDYEQPYESEPFVLPEPLQLADLEDDSLAEDAAAFAAASPGHGTQAPSGSHTPGAQNGAASFMPKDLEAYEDAADKTMEETVKEMLRPLLRDWLDRNMERVLETALREELIKRDELGGN